jgi:Holliday junction resolvase-like predicted endonuclease
MEINKSTRHSKLAGDFGETLVVYWLSKYGFECAKVDHTGIDLIARNPHSKEVLGISVKSRTRSTGAENEFVKLPADNFDKIEAACRAFNCVPYFAIVVDAGDTIRVFITSVARALELYPRTAAGSGWRMSPAYLAKYADDSQVMAFELQIKHGRWWKEPVGIQTDSLPTSH